MKAAVSFSGFKLYTILQQDFHVEGHRPQQGWGQHPKAPVAMRLRRQRACAATTAVETSMICLSRWRPYKPQLGLVCKAGGTLLSTVSHNKTIQNYTCYTTMTPYILSYT